MKTPLVYGGVLLYNKECVVYFKRKGRITMIKLPKDVKDILAKLSKNGFRAYCIGGCVRDSLCGLKPSDWDIATNAKYEDLKNLFPEFKTLSEKYSVIRNTFPLREGTDEETEITVDIATFRKEGIYSDGRKPDNVTFVDTIEEDLPRRDFTINALGDNGFEFIDEYNGREDIKNKIVKTIGSANEKFAEDPVRMLRAIRLAAELDFDLSKEVYEAIKANYMSLSKVSLDRFRSEFMKIIGAPHGGRGLNMIIDTGILSFVLNGNDAKHLTRREKQDLITICNKMDGTKPIAERRLGLFYSILGKRKAQASIRKLQFDADLTQHLMDATNLMPKFFYAVNEKALKRFIFKYGEDRFDYCFNLEKAQRIALDVDIRLKIEAKVHFINEIKMQNQVVFPEDLRIDENDLIEAGIAKNMENAKLLILWLTEVCHDKNHLNTREKLLERAKKSKVYLPYLKLRYAKRIKGIIPQR